MNNGRTRRRRGGRADCVAKRALQREMNPCRPGQGCGQLSWPLADLRTGSFLGGARSGTAMQCDCAYPTTADRDAPVTLGEKGRPKACGRANLAARPVQETHHPADLSPVAKARMRGTFPIRLEAA